MVRMVIVDTGSTNRVQTDKKGNTKLIVVRMVIVDTGSTNRVQTDKKGNTIC